MNQELLEEQRAQVKELEAAATRAYMAKSAQAADPTHKAISEIELLTNGVEQRVQRFLIRMNRTHAEEEVQKELTPIAASFRGHPPPDVVRDIRQKYDDGLRAEAAELSRMLDTCDKGFREQCKGLSRLSNPADTADDLLAMRRGQEIDRELRRFNNQPRTPAQFIELLESIPDDDVRAFIIEEQHEKGWPDVQRQIDRNDADAEFRLRKAIAARQEKRLAARYPHLVAARKKFQSLLTATLDFQLRHLLQHQRGVAWVNR